MRRIYAGLAWIIAGGVVVQAAADRVRASAAMLNHVSEGGVVDKALLESGGAGGTGELGFWIHGIVGGGVIPLLAVRAAHRLVLREGARARGCGRPSCSGWSCCR